MHSGNHGCRISRRAGNHMLFSPPSVQGAVCYSTAFDNGQTARTLKSQDCATEIRSQRLSTMAEENIQNSGNSFRRQRV